MKKKEPIWVREDVVLAMHKTFILEYGGTEGIRDLGLLSSALERPENLFAYHNPTPSLSILGASYAYGITKNHPFLDGNKRISFATCQLFLKLNHVQLEVSSLEKYKMFYKLASGEVTEAELAHWIEQHI